MSRPLTAVELNKTYQDYPALFKLTIRRLLLKLIEGVKASGANSVQLMRYAILPQVFPVILSNIVYYFESNTRSATILGIVGAGGIGLQLADRIRVLAWDQASLIIIMILITVYLIDAVSNHIRQRFIKIPGHRLSPSNE